MGSTVRQRRHATAVREILDAAHAEVAAHGPAGLSVRSIARSLGMTVQALYHYFPSRSELVTALIAESYHDLANVVQSTLDTSENTADTQFVIAAGAFRAWAIENPTGFQLLYGTPLVDYSAPAEGPTTSEAGRLGDILVRALFAEDDPTHADVARQGMSALPPDALSMYISAWGHMHGLVSLEVFGHTVFMGSRQAGIFREAMEGVVDGVRRRSGERVE